MNNYQENKNNFIGTSAKSVNWFAKPWVADMSKLSGDDTELMRTMGFPFELAPHMCVGKRIKKFHSNDTWHFKENILISDFIYLCFTKNLAAYQINKDTAVGETAELLQASKVHIGKVNRSLSVKQVYIDGHHIQAELDWLLHNFSSPKPTKSMKVEASTVSDEPIETPKEKPKKRSKSTTDKSVLSDGDKAKIEEMASNGASAKEIANEIKKFKTVVVDYLKSFKK